MAYKKQCLSVAITTLLLLSGCKETAEKQVDTPIRPVKSVLSTTLDKPGVRLFSGVTQTSQEIDLSFKVSGTIANIPAKLGDTIMADELIAELDDESYLVLLAQAKADVAKTFATQKSSRAEYNRNLELYKKKVVSKNQLEQSEAEANSSQAAYDAAKLAEKLAQLNLDDTTLSVPDTCRIADVYVRQNENVTSGQPIVKASCGDTWEVHINVPESLISEFAKGMFGSIKFPSLPGKTFEGFVSEVGIATNGSSSFPVTLEFTDPPQSIRTNIAAEVSLNVTVPENLRGIVYVPSAAVVADHEGAYVYLVEKSEKQGIATLTRQPVTVGLLTPYGIEVVSGLEANKEVLLAGHVNAREGMEVLATITE